jgi:hypothetical protein
LAGDIATPGCHNCWINLEAVYVGGYRDELLVDDAAFLSDTCHADPIQLQQVSNAHPRARWGWG